MSGSVCVCVSWQEKILTSHDWSGGEHGGGGRGGVIRKVVECTHRPGEKLAGVSSVCVHVELRTTIKGSVSMLFF